MKVADVGQASGLPVPGTFQCREPTRVARLRIERLESRSNWQTGMSALQGRSRVKPNPAPST